METFKVFGKLKRKELSFGFNDVRGVNKREERLLRSALGSIEIQRKRSLQTIQNEVEDLHITLKETNNVWQGYKHPVHDQLEIQPPKCQTPIINDKRPEESILKMVEKQSPIKDDLKGTSNQKEISEATNQDLLVPGSSLQHVNISNVNKTKTSERILRRPRNTSTGSITKNFHQETPAHEVLDSRKTASYSDVYKLASRANTNITPTGATTFIRDEKSQDRIFYKRDHYQRSASTENITCSREKMTVPFFSPQIRQKKLSAEMGSLSSASSSAKSTPILTRKMGTSQSLNSFANTYAELSPIPTRRVTTIERQICRSAVRHKPITRMTSCPQLNCNQKAATNDYRTLSSMKGERSLSRMSTELPELMAGHKKRDDKRDETEHNYRCVSPNNLERTMMDKNLQNKINAFLNSLADNESCESSTCVEDIE